MSVAEVRQRTGLSHPAAGTTLALLSELGLVRELTGRRRDRLFAYQRSHQLLDAADRG